MTSCNSSGRRSAPRALVVVALAILLPSLAAAAPVLLSQGKPVVASSLEGTLVAANAVDGNTGTRWGSAFSDPQWIYVDLGQPASITRVVLTWEAAFGKAFQLQTSSDAATWTTIYSTASSAGGVNDLTVTGTGRYVRMYGTARGTQWGYSLWELQVYGSYVPVTTLLSQGRPVVASSLEGTLVAANAVDGNTGTRWGSAFSDPQWIQVDLGSVATVSQVVLNWEAAYGKAYQLQTSADGSAWSTIYSTAAGAGGVETLNVSGSGRYLRLYGTARGTAYGYSLWELSVYGAAGPPPVCATLPGAPTGLTASGLSSSGVSLAWAAPAAGAGCTITSYRVYSGSALVATVASPAASIDGLSASTSYAFAVSAVNGYGEGPRSAALAVTTAPSGTGFTWPTLAARSDGKWVRVRNNCPFTVWVHGAGGSDVVLTPDDQPLATGEHRDYVAPNSWPSARVTAYGDGPRTNELEKVELTFGDGWLNYNVTYVDWVGLPMEVTGVGGTCTAAAHTTGCYAPEATLTTGCPEGVLKDGKKCLSPRTYCANPVNQSNPLCHLLDGAIASCPSCPKDTTTNVWMCAGLYANEPRWCAALQRGMVSAPDDPDQTHYYLNPPYSTYSKWVHQVCPDIYAFPYDDWLSHGGFRNCQGDEVRVTFCPGG